MTIDDMKKMLAKVSATSPREAALLLGLLERGEDPEVIAEIIMTSRMLNSVNDLIPRMERLAAVFNNELAARGLIAIEPFLVGIETMLAEADRRNNGALARAGMGYAEEDHGAFVAKRREELSSLLDKVLAKKQAASAA